ncbi:MAG: helix-turn-helix domain-containing protein [bacterium]
MKNYFHNFTYLPKTIAEQLKTFFLKKEDVVVLLLPGIGARRNAYEISSGSFFKLFPQENFSNYVFIKIDIFLKQPYLDRQLEEELAMHSQELGIRNQIKDILKQNKIIYFLINKYTSENLDFLNYLWTFRGLDYDQIKFLIFSEESSFHDEATRCNDTIMSHNIIQVPYLNQEQTTEWLQINAKKHGVSLQSEEILQIYQFTGGIPALLRNCLRGIARYQNLEQVFTSNEMQLLSKDLFSRYSERERYLIRSIKIKNTVPPYFQEFQYLAQHGLINQENQIPFTWIDQVLADENKQLIIQINANQILWEEIAINELLSQNELEILLVLLRAEEITKEQIAKIIWKAKVNELYSEWALDQVISRLRKKLDKIGIGGRIIKTNRTKGYSIQNVVIQNS